MSRLVKHRSRKKGLAPGTLVHIGEERGAKTSIDVTVYDANHLEMRPLGSLAQCPVMQPSPSVTWINVDGLSPAELREAMPVIRARCEEIERDPDSLAVSVHAWWGTPGWKAAGAPRVELLGAYAELGVSRVIGLLQASAEGDDALERLAEDARAAGVELATG